MLPQSELSRRNSADISLQTVSEMRDVDDKDYLSVEMNFERCILGSSSPKLKRKRQSRDSVPKSFEGAGILPPAGETEWDPSKQLYHTGKWPIEEERYANRLVREFEAGLLEDCRDGVTLRSYLAKTLRCAPMRVSKKLAGKCIGSKVFCRRRGDRKTLDEEIAASELDLASLQKRIKQNSIKISRSRSASDLTDDEDSSGTSSCTDDREDCDSETSRPEGAKSMKAKFMASKEMEFAYTYRGLDGTMGSEDIFICPLLTDFDNTTEYGSHYYLSGSTESGDENSHHIVDVGYDEWRDALSYFKESECVPTPSEEL